MLIRLLAALAALLMLGSAAYAQSDLEKALEKELLCVSSDRTLTLVHPEKGGGNQALKAAGARITFDDDGPYNNFIYHFDKPLMVFGMPLWSVRQSVHEHGATLSAEITGDAAAFARRMQARQRKTADGEQYYLADEVRYLKPVGKGPLPDLMIIGVTPGQQANGRFEADCYRQMEL